MLKGLILIPAIYIGRKTIGQHALMFKNIVKVFVIVAPLFIFLTAMSVVFNIVGMVNLSDVLLNGILISVALGMVVFVAVKIATNLLLFGFQIRKVKHVEALSIMVEATTKRFQPIIAFLGFVLWLVYTLQGFDVYRNVLEWVVGLLDISWNWEKRRFH